MKSKLEIKNRKACLQIGNKLIEGPLALFPPPKSKGDGWLECDLRIFKYSPNYRKQESVAIYTDDTMNKESDFLKPVLRHCIWDRHKDMNGSNSWPSVDIQLGHIKDITKVSEILVELQSSIPKFSFASCGVSLTRDSVEVKCNHNEVSYVLFMRNGVQSLTYSSCSILGDEATVLILNSYNSFLNEQLSIEKIGWQERYEYNLREESPKEMWNWSYGA